MLGCGTSTGVPMVASNPPIARSPNPKDHRLRSAIYLEAAGSHVLIDTGPDLRTQCLLNNITRIDAVLYTHAHADHVHGIDDIRGFNIARGGPIDCYGHADVLGAIEERFSYAFQPWSGRGFWRPMLTPHHIDGPFRIGNLEVAPFEQIHARQPSWGYRFGPFAYSTDVKDLPPASFQALRGIEVWIVDALRYEPHPSHAHVDQVLAWVTELGVKRTILTHMNHEMFYDELIAGLPKGVEPGYDGLVIELADA